MKNENAYSWDSINGDQYFDILDILNDKDMDEITKQAELVAIVEGCSADDVLSLSMTEAATKFNKLVFFNKFELLPKYNPKKLNINGIEYDVVSTDKMTVSQYIDYQNYVTHPWRDSYYEILSLFIIPSGKKYNDGYDVLDVQRTIRTMLSWREIQSILNFILRSSVKSALHTQKYLRRKLKWMPKKTKKIMENQLREMNDQIVSFLSMIGSR